MAYTIHWYVHMYIRKYFFSFIVNVFDAMSQAEDTATFFEYLYCFTRGVEICIFLCALCFTFAYNPNIHKYIDYNSG